MGPVLYRLLKVARRMRKRADAFELSNPFENKDLQKAVTIAKPKPVDTSAYFTSPTGMSTTNIAGGLAGAFADANNWSTSDPTRAIPGGSSSAVAPPSAIRLPKTNFASPPGLNPPPLSTPTGTAPTQAPGAIQAPLSTMAPIPERLSAKPPTWHDNYQRQRDELRHQVRMGNMSTWQAQKNMQHWRETNRPGQNGQKLGIPGGDVPTTQGFNYMLRQMAPTGTNAQNLREIRKAFNAATPQMRNTMFSNAMNLWQQGYTGKALNLNMMQAPVEQQAPPAG